MKKILLIIGICVTLTLFTGCSLTNDNKENSKYIIDISLEEFKEKIENKETFAIFVGNESCSHCISYRPILEQVLEDYKITIYHLDNSKLSSDEYAEFRSYVNISGTPTVAFITNGEEESTLNRIVGEVSRQTTIDRFKANGYIK